MCFDFSYEESARNKSSSMFGNPSINRSWFNKEGLARFGGILTSTIFIHEASCAEYTRVSLRNPRIKSLKTAERGLQSQWWSLLILIVFDNLYPSFGFMVNA